MAAVAVQQKAVALPKAPVAEPMVTEDGGHTSDGDLYSRLKQLQRQLEFLEIQVIVALWAPLEPLTAHPMLYQGQKGARTRRRARQDATARLPPRRQRHPALCWRRRRRLALTGSPSCCRRSTSRRSRRT